MKSSLSRRVAAEFLGTAFLVAAIVGSGIMGERLANGDAALALLANAIATGAAQISFLFIWYVFSLSRWGRAACIAYTDGRERKFEQGI